MEPATNLISVNRLDVFSKTPLAFAWANDLDETWGLELYTSYMLSTRPSTGFAENNSKFSLVDYVESFRKLFKSLKTQGFDPSISAIPATQIGITDGSHRLAASLVLGKQVKRAESSELDHNYDFRFMQSVNFPENLIESTVLEFLEYAKNCTVFCAMGVTPKLASNIQKCLSDSDFNIVYIKSLILSRIGQRRLMKVLYGSNNWWSSELYEILSVERFSDSLPSYFFFVISKPIEEEVTFKNKIRKLFFDDFSYKKFHSTDNREESIRVSESVLNKNSLVFLNEAPIESERRIIELIDDHPYLSTLSPKNFAVDGSANLEIFGIRKAKDLDFIEIEHVFSEKPTPSASHNSEYKGLPINPTSLIIDPRNFATIEGYKFVNIPQTISFKAHRSEQKDLLDITNLCNKNVSGIVYNNYGRNRELKYLRLKTVVRRRVNILISPLPNEIQVTIRKIYVKIRDFLF